MVVETVVRVTKAAYNLLIFCASGEYRYNVIQRAAFSPSMDPEETDVLYVRPTPVHPGR